MTKEETISNLKAYLDGDIAVGNIIPLRFILESAIKYLSEPSLPSNLDEVAEEYGRKEYSHAIHFWDEGLSKNKPEVMKEDFVDAFKAGAEWMARQGYTREVDIKEDAGGYPYIQSIELYDYDKEEPLFNTDKVIVQIRKIL